MAQAASLACFYAIARKIVPDEEAAQRLWIYTVLLLALPYNWWYFDALVVALTLAGLKWVLEGKDFQAGLAIGAGILSKLFPALLLPGIWLVRKHKRAVGIIALAIGLTAGVYLWLFLIAPEMSAASLRSQASKGSWETVWALLDGNLTTGLFGGVAERFDPQAAGLLRGNPARITPWITLAVFGLAGAGFFLKARLESAQSMVAFTGVTWCIFLLWSPGYSPQWLLYTLPFILLVLPLKSGLLLAAACILINIMEWPLMLTRGYNWGLWITIPIRTLLTALQIFEYWKVCQASSANREGI